MRKGGRPAGAAVGGVPRERGVIAACGVLDVCLRSVRSPTSLGASAVTRRGVGRACRGGSADRQRVGGAWASDCGAARGVESTAQSDGAGCVRAKWRPITAKAEATRGLKKSQR